MCLKASGNASKEADTDLASSPRQALCVVDLGFGDSGKGLTVDALCRLKPVHTVVRYNGGAQAGHTVVTDDGRWHTFSQIGAGSFLPHLHTHLSKHMVCNPLALLLEAQVIERKGVAPVLPRLTIHHQALLITPFHQALNRLRELARGGSRHGSVGVGVGETVADATGGATDVLRAEHMHDLPAAKRHLQSICERKRFAAKTLSGADHPLAARELQVFEAKQVIDTYLSALENLKSVVVDHDFEQRLAARDGTLLFEGAQGVLLDERHGFFPHVTYGSCTLDNANALLRAWDFQGDVSRFGVIRAVMTRHGAGPLPTEDEALSASWHEPHNAPQPWQGRFRVGHADTVLWKTALTANGAVDGLVLTHLDRFKSLTEPKACVAYRTAEQKDLVQVPANGEQGCPTHESRLKLLDAVTCQWHHFDHPDPNKRAAGLTELLEERLATPVAFSSTGPTAQHLQTNRQLRPKDH